MKPPYFERTLIVAVVLVLASCQKNVDAPVPPENYLTKWYGTYKGTSHQWRRLYIDTTWVEYHFYKDLVIDVQKGDLDSTLKFYFTYDDTVLVASKNLKFKKDGTHYSFNPSHSDGSTLNIAFYSDTLLDYKYWKMLGIPNTYQEEFVLVKQ